MAKATEETPVESTNRVYSTEGIPKSKRGRRAAEVDLSMYEADVEEVKKNLGVAIGYENQKPALARDLKRYFGVNTSMRNIKPVPKEGNVGTVWMEWPSYEADDGQLYEDTDQVTENLEG